MNEIFYEEAFNNFLWVWALMFVEKYQRNKLKEEMKFFKI